MHIWRCIATASTANRPLFSQNMIDGMGCGILRDRALLPRERQRQYLFSRSAVPWSSRGLCHLQNVCFCFSPHVAEVCDLIGNNRQGTRENRVKENEPCALLTRAYVERSSKAPRRRASYCSLSLTLCSRKLNASKVQ